MVASADNPLNTEETPSQNQIYERMRTLRQQDLPFANVCKLSQHLFENISLSQTFNIKLVATPCRFPCITWEYQKFLLYLLMNLVFADCLVQMLFTLMVLLKLLQEQVCVKSKSSLQLVLHVFSVRHPKTGAGFPCVYAFLDTKTASQ